MQKSRVLHVGDDEQPSGNVWKAPLCYIIDFGTKALLPLSSMVWYGSARYFERFCYKMGLSSQTELYYF